MEIKLLHHTPLWVASTAIRKCWASEGKSDTEDEMINPNDYSMDECTRAEMPEAGEKDKELIHRVGNKNKHSSTLEHLNYTFDIDGISRACLQELARHRHASLSVKSTRYTLKELKGAPYVENFLVEVGHEKTDYENVLQLEAVQGYLKEGVSNDKIKYMLPEAYKTSLVWTINARSLQNFLSLRTSKAALWEIRDLANNIFTKLPKEHKYLFEEYIYE